VWAGIDVGKTHHWVCVLDADGQKLLSMKVANDQSDITATIATVADLGDRIVWAIDIVGAPSAMLLALLIQAGQSVRYASGRVVAAMSAAYSGEGKTDLLTELSAGSCGGCVRHRAGLARFAACDRRWGCASGFVEAGGAAAGLSRDDGRSVSIVSAR
jgi:hypothetical protein